MSVIPDDRRLSDAVTEAERAGGRIDVAHDGERVGAVVSAEYIDSLYETLEVASDPELVAAIAEGDADIAAGRVIDAEEIEAEFLK